MAGQKYTKFSPEINSMDQYDEAFVSLENVPSVEDEYPTNEYDVDFSVEELNNCAAEEEVQNDVENVLISILSTPQRANIATLVGQRPNTPECVALDSSFLRKYAKACSVNPALTWYAKLATILPENQFFANNGELTLKISKKQFDKIIKPFIADFRSENSGSAIVQSILNIKAALEEQENGNKLQAIMPKTNSVCDKTSEKQCTDQAAMDVCEVEDAVEGDKELSSLIEAEFGEEGIRNALSSAKMGLKLADLANKHVAEMLNSKYASIEEARNALVEEGFDSRRVNEVSQIISLMRMASVKRPHETKEFEF